MSTTVAAPYTAASGTLEVADATGMPATGDFRIRLGNIAGSILKVTARSGTTLTVEEEEDDGDAATGDAVRLIVTAGAMEALKADAIAGGGGGGGMPWWPTITPLDTSTWAWINQGTAAVVEASDVTRMAVPAVTDNLRLLKKAAPATPWVITSLVQIDARLASYSRMGIAMRESGTGQIMTVALVHAGGLSVDVAKHNSASSFNATAASLGFGSWPSPAWLRIADDGTNVVFSYSLDGVNFVQLFSEARTTFLPPDEVGIVGDSSQAAAASWFSWVEA